MVDYDELRAQAATLSRGFGRILAGFWRAGPLHPDRLSPIGDLIEDVLAWSGVELVVVEPSKSAYDPAELAEDVRAVVRDLWKQTGRPGHQGKRAGNLAAELAREFEGGNATD